MDSGIGSTTRTAGQDENHRARVGRDKRRRMRARLMQSVISVCAEQSPTGSAVIEDVVRHAQVSRGTFYKHFDTLEQAVSQVAAELAEQMADDIGAVYDTLADPLMRTATGFQTFLLRALLDAEWGGFMTHLGLVAGGGKVFAKIRSDIESGIETGDYVVDGVDIAIDILIGAKAEAIRRIVAGRRDLGYVRSVTAMVLRSFGVAPGKADDTVLRAHERLLAEAPGKIAWWRPLGS